MTRCWECGRTIPPAERVRWRRTQVSDGYQHGLVGGSNAQYSQVPLCAPCDEAIEAEEQQWRVKRTNGVFTLAGVGGMTLLLVVLGVPGWPAFLASCGLAVARVLWWSIAMSLLLGAVLTGAGVRIENNLPLLPLFVGGWVVAILAVVVEKRRRKMGSPWPVRDA
jgi:hypothetical protein